MAILGQRRIAVSSCYLLKVAGVRGHPTCSLTPSYVIDESNHVTALGIPCFFKRSYVTDWSLANFSKTNESTPTELPSTSRDPSSYSRYAPPYPLIFQE